MENLFLLANNFLSLLDAMSLYIIIGLFIAGILKQIIPNDFISSHLGTNSNSAVIKATILGIPLPVCSCSVIPLAQGLKKEGASKGAVQSFLISSPITGVDSILATFSFFGLFFTIFRLCSSILIAIIVGLLQNFFEKKEIKKEQKFTFTVKDNFKVKAQIKNEIKNSSCCSSTKEEAFLIRVAKYAYGTLFSDMAKALLIGLVLGAVFTSFMPKEYSKLLFENEILTYFVILLLAIPLYTCATASLPIAAALMIEGMSPGAAFLFLTAGPATSLVTMSVVYKMLGKLSLIIYTSTIATLSLIFAFAFDFFFSDLTILDSMLHLEESSLLSSLSSFFVLLLIIFHLFKSKFKKTETCNK